jgi:hypothetical protein
MGLDNGYMQCETCGIRIAVTSKSKKYCSSCLKTKERELTRKRVEKYRNRRKSVTE